MLPKIIVIVGPTASGKTALALRLAKKFNGEIINADSRQVYKGMDIGTAKAPNDGKQPRRPDIKSGVGVPTLRRGKQSGYLVQGIPHYLIDIINPDEEFTLAHYKELAFEAIDGILRRGKLPIVAGGTGLYARTIIDNLDIPKVASDPKLRSELEKKGLPELTAKLREFDPEAAGKIDLRNPRRVIRALEVAILSGRSFSEQQTKSAPRYEALQIGLRVGREELNSRISRRVEEQIKDGLVEEVSRLSKKYSWNLPAMSGIGYKQIGYYLRKEMGLPEAIELIKRDTRRYAKRQMTWFGRDERIRWIKDAEEAEGLAKEFLNF